MTISRTWRQWIGRGLLVVGLLPVQLSAQSGAASLAGRVVRADQPAEGVRRAEVTAAGVGSSVRVSAIADDQGRFSFNRLPPGRYLVSASKSTYVTTTLGARPQNQGGTPLVLAAGQHVGDVVLALQRGGVIAGAVRDATGTPVANLPVTVAPADRGEAQTSGLPRLLPAGAPERRMAVTDDRGNYRIFGLAPGEYLVAAVPPAGAVGASSTGSMASSGAAPNSRPVSYGYAPVFYPGTPAAENAAWIRVSIGEEHNGIDLTFDLVRLVSIEGTVFLPDGRPATGARVSAHQVGQTLPGVVSLAGRATVASDGGFTIAGVPPGRYEVIAGTPEPEPLTWATTDVFVLGADVTGLTLNLQPTMSLSGRVMFKDAGAAPTPVIVWLRRAPEIGDRTVPGVAGPQRTTATARDGSFVITGILPGRFELTVQPAANAGPGWRLESAVADGRDLLDQPLEFGRPPQDVKDAVLTLTDRRTELTGRLQTAAGQPATEYFVIVFSANRAHWFPGARRTRAVRPASDGSFSVTDLPAGAYLLAALTDVATDEWHRPSFLEAIAPLSVPITMPDAGVVRQDLQIAGPPGSGAN